MAYTKKERSFIKRLSIDVAGFSMMIIAPLIGWVPGPGGIPLFLAGLALVATNHVWAENLLKNFDKKRSAFTKKYLLTGPKVSLAIDIIAGILLVGALYIAFTQQMLIYRGVGLAGTTITLIVILSNQQRIDRFEAWWRKRRHNS